MNPVFVTGVGLFTPGYGSARAWCEGKEDPSVEKPEAALLDGALRRRATPLTRLAIDAFAQATAMSGSDLTTIPTVWATAHGEHTPAIKMLAMMKTGEGRVSPTQFHNSVHNTAGGYASIASNNTTCSTTVTGGSELVGAALLEAWCLVSERGGDVAVVFADEPLMAPFEQALPTAPLSAALVLSSSAEGALARLDKLERLDVPVVEGDARFGALYVAAAVPLVERVIRREPGRVSLEARTTAPEPAKEPIWSVELGFDREVERDVRE